MEYMPRFKIPPDWVPLWTPAKITTLGWFDAQDSGTIVQADTAGRVSQWTDKGTAAANHFLQATAGNQPTTGVDTISGFNALGFNGTAYYMAMGSNPFGASVSNAFVFFVMNIKTRTASTLFSLTGGTTDGTRWQAHVPYVDNTCYFDCGGITAPNRVSYATGWADNRNVIMGFYCSTTASVQQIWEDGTQKAGDATGQTVSTTGNPSIGSNALLEYDACSIGEVVIINGTVSATDRQLIEGYLAWRWGLQGNLPGGHPFESYAPRSW
jgi:hypothetical protein